MAEFELEQTPEMLEGCEVPAAERGARAVLAAADAVERLRRGQTLRNVQIERPCFRGEFPLPVRLENCVLVRPRFDGAAFDGDVAFVGCVLDRPVWQRDCVFGRGLALTGSTVLGGAFCRLTVRGAFDASHLETRGRFQLLGCEFGGPVRFWEARFGGWVQFKRCAFAAEADLRSFQAEQGFVVNDCWFHADVLLRGSSVAMKCDLSGSHFDGLLDLSKAKLHDYVYLEDVEQGPRQQFAFWNTVGERILVRRSQLRGRLASEQRGDYRQAMHEYAFLRRSFEELHRYDEEDWAFYRFKVNQRRSCPRSWLRPWTKLAELADYLLLDHGCGYGTNPMRAVRSALLIMLGFGLLYMAGIEHFYVDPAKRPFPDEEMSSPWNRVWMGLTISVTVFTSGVAGIREMAGGWMNGPLMVESLLGTLLWGLFIVAFSRKVIR